MYVCLWEFVRWCASAYMCRVCCGLFLYLGGIIATKAAIKERDSKRCGPLAVWKQKGSERENQYALRSEHHADLVKGVHVFNGITISGKKHIFVITLVMCILDGGEQILKFNAQNLRKFPRECPKAFARLQPRNLYT